MSLKQITDIINQFNSSLGLPLTDLIPTTLIESLLREEKIQYRNRLFNPIVTLWTFLLQVLSPEKSCQNAVSKISSFLAEKSQKLLSGNTSAYCQARKRLPELFLAKLFVQLGQKLEEKTQSNDLWCGRHVAIFDGSSVSMPDTLSNQEAYPQHSSQKKGCGFPLAKIGVLFSLTTGACLNIIIDKFNTAEIKMARKLYDNLAPGWVFLSDRALCSYADIYFLKERSCDVVVRLSASRKQPHQKGRKTKPSDQLVIWNKPKTRQHSLSKEEFNLLPKTLTLREINYYVCIAGFRASHVTIVTTLLDEEAYPKSEIINLYRKRWSIELDLRHIKTTLGMDILSCKTPDMARKEIYIYLLAYNLIRQIMWSSGLVGQVDPLSLSFQATINYFLNFLPLFSQSIPKKRQDLYRVMLRCISHNKLLVRPGRVYLRVVKRRPKSYPRLSTPRPNMWGQKAV